MRRLVLADFRSYAALDLDVGGDCIVLTGENGAGKTNLLEALSLFTPGRGLRRADLADCARVGGAGGWAASIEIDAGRQSPARDRDRSAGRACRRRSANTGIDRAPVGSARAFCEYLRIVWLTPAMDGLFLGPAGDRRRFLDRLVLAVDAEHGARVNALERALRNRNRLLEEATGEARWLDAAERELAELAVAVAAARHETVSRLAGLIARDKDAASPFPWADIALAGDLEALIALRPALEIEEHYRRLLRDNRARDAAARRTLVGPQASDLVVRHGPKGVAAARSSTGEQKALLVGLVLAHARLVAAMSGIAPLVLLDEIAAHFDAARRAALYAGLSLVGGQVWMTGADPATFAALSGRAQMFNVVARANFGDGVLRLCRSAARVEPFIAVRGVSFQPGIPI